MRRILGICAVFALLVPISSLACRELVVFPAHLEADDSKYYYVVSIERAEGDSFIGRIERSFGGPFSVGQVVTIRFKEDEEAHAVCPVDIAFGKTYLLRSESTVGALEISRFNWLNVPAEHNKFSVYVQDLEQTQRKR